MKQTISFDLDDTLFNVVEMIVKHSNKHWGTNIDYKTVDPDRVFPGLDEQEENMLWLRFLAHPDTVNHAPSKQIKDAIDKLSKDYRLIIVSARDMIFQKQAIAWVKKFFPNKFDKVIFKKSKKGNIPKSDICIREKAIVHFDDNAKHVKDCMKNGIPAVLISRPWNKDSNLSVPRMSDISLSGVKEVLSILP